jgi:hypothetical protein
VNSLTGLNVQAPWSNLLINGLKTVETRTYQLPDKYHGEPLALIETPGKKGKFKSRIIGIITFSHSFVYQDKQSWINDYQRHKVEEDDKNYGWNDNKVKYGWVISDVIKFDKPIDPPQKRGIIFTSNCHIH